LITGRSARIGPRPWLRLGKITVLEIVKSIWRLRPRGGGDLFAKRWVTQAETPVVAAYSPRNEGWIAGLRASR